MASASFGPGIIIDVLSYKLSEHELREAIKSTDYITRSLIQSLLEIQIGLFPLTSGSFVFEVPRFGYPTICLRWPIFAVAR